MSKGDLSTLRESGSLPLGSLNGKIQKPSLKPGGGPQTDKLDVQFEEAFRTQTAPTLPCLIRYTSYAGGTVVGTGEKLLNTVKLWWETFTPVPMDGLCIFMKVCKHFWSQGRLEKEATKRHGKCLSWWQGWCIGPVSNLFCFQEFRPHKGKLQSNRDKLAGTVLIPHHFLRVLLA